MDNLSATYDARGLVELDGTIPKISEIDGERAVLDARELSTRKINAELRWLLYEQGIKDVTVLNPSARHSLGTGILTRCRITFEGSLGYFGAGLIDGPEIQINGRVGWSVAENMMSGVVVIESNAGSLTGAALRGGDLVVNNLAGYAFTTGRVLIMSDGTPTLRVLDPVTFREVRRIKVTADGTTCTATSPSVAGAGAVDQQHQINLVLGSDVK